MAVKKYNEKYLMMDKSKKEKSILKGIKEILKTEHHFILAVGYEKADGDNQKLTIKNKREVQLIENLNTQILLILIQGILEQIMVEGNIVSEDITDDDKKKGDA